MPKTTLKSNVIFRVTSKLLGFTPSSGPPGTVVTITGVSLTQTSIVTFDGSKTTAFTVESDREVEATVPTGAKTGKRRDHDSGWNDDQCRNFHRDPVML